MNTQLIVAIKYHFYFFAWLIKLLGVDFVNFKNKSAFPRAILDFQFALIYDLPPILAKYFPVRLASNHESLQSAIFLN